MKQKTDREDARLMLKLLRDDRFPKIWVPSPNLRPKTAGGELEIDIEETRIVLYGWSASVLSVFDGSSLIRDYSVPVPGVPTSRLAPEPDGR